MIKIAILGFGTVGSGVADVITQNSDVIASNAGAEIGIKYILDLREFPDSPFGNLIVHDFDIIVNDPEIRIVAEMMGGIHPAYEFTKRCLLAGKHVVTSNKELVAACGTELLKIARDNNLNYMFEASVGGGIPVIRPLNQCLTANRIDEVVGILNGTTNYILTQMINNHIAFEDALKDAQEKGYAERDPSADIEGLDACRKIAILASLAYGKYVNPEKVYTEGITKISLRDVNIVSQDDKVIKLLGHAKKLENGQVFCMVSPCIIGHDNPLSTIDDVFNGILIRGNFLGDAMFYGRGAGKYPTASAVVADIIDSAKHFERRKWFNWDTAPENYVADYRDNPISYYIRLSVNEANSALNNINSLLENCRILLNEQDELAFITPVKPERELITYLDMLKSKPDITDIKAVIRVI